MKCLKSLLVLIVVLCLVWVPRVIAQSGEIPVDLKVLPNIVKIEAISELNNKPITGTGFIVSREVKVASEVRRLRFLVTNKHMLSDWTLADGNNIKFNKYLKIHFYSANVTPEHPTEPKNIDPCDKDGQVLVQKVQEHINPLVDVAIVLLEHDLNKFVGINVPTFDVSYLLPFDKITARHFNIGSQVFVLGYPLGITSLRSNHPIAKFGYIATTPGEEFAIDITETDRKGIPKNIKLVGKLLVIDGLMVGGNSGGPVILPSVIKTRINPESGKWEY